MTTPLDELISEDNDKKVKANATDIDEFKEEKRETKYQSSLGMGLMVKPASIAQALKQNIAGSIYNKLNSNYDYNSVNVLFVGVHNGKPEIDFLKKYLMKNSFSKVHVHLAQYVSSNNSSAYKYDSKDINQLKQLPLIAEIKTYYGIDARYLHNYPAFKNIFFHHIVWIGPNHPDRNQKLPKGEKNRKQYILKTGEKTINLSIREFIDSAEQILYPSRGTIHIIQDLSNRAFRSLLLIPGLVPTKVLPTLDGRQSSKSHLIPKACDSHFIVIKPDPASSNFRNKVFEKNFTNHNVGDIHSPKVDLKMQIREYYSEVFQQLAKEVSNELLLKCLKNLKFNFLEWIFSICPNRINEAIKIKDSIRTPLEIAANLSNKDTKLQLMKFLINHDACVSGPKSNWFTLNRMLKRDIFTMKLLMDSKKIDLTQVVFPLNTTNPTFPDLLRAQNVELCQLVQGDTLLHLACLLSFKKLVSHYFLVIKGREVNIMNNEGNTPLHYALQACKVVIELEKLKANKTPSPRVFNKEGAFKIVDTLLRFNANRKAKNKCDKTPIDIAGEISNSMKNKVSNFGTLSFTAHAQPCSKDDEEFKESVNTWENETTEGIIFVITHPRATGTVLELFLRQLLNKYKGSNNICYKHQPLLDPYLDWSNKSNRDEINPQPDFILAAKELMDQARNKLTIVKIVTYYAHSFWLNNPLLLSKKTKCMIYSREPEHSLLSYHKSRKENGKILTQCGYESLYFLADNLKQNNKPFLNIKSEDFLNNPKALACEFLGWAIGEKLADDNVTSDVLSIKPVVLNLKNLSTDKNSAYYSQVVQGGSLQRPKPRLDRDKDGNPIFLEDKTDNNYLVELFKKEKTWHTLLHSPIVILQKEPFNKIKKGSKMAEGRLKRDQFQNFCASDTILFVHHEEKVLVRIDEILHANSFSEILSDDLPLAKSLGFDTTESAIRRYNDLYDKKNQIAKGVCIFKFSCVVKFLNEIPTPAPARVANPPISTQRELNFSQFSDNNIELDDSDSTSKRFTFCNII